MRLLEKLAKRVSASVNGTSQAHSDEEDEDEIDDDEEDYEIDDELVHIEGGVGRSQIDRTILQRCVLPSFPSLSIADMVCSEFNEAVAYNYSPGYIPFGVDDFALSISMPAKSLADTIPARALIAWDKRLLSRPQHLTLLISGLRGVYPVVQHDATLNQAAHVHGATLQFRVGLTTDYKPMPEDAADMVRKFGLKEEYGAQPTEPDEPVVDSEDLFGEYDDKDDMIEDLDEEQPAPEEEPDVPFRPFSLSSSLESLLNNHFLRILQFRIKYDLGWAGAETLQWEFEKTQQPPGDIMRLRGQVRLAGQIFL